MNCREFAEIAIALSKVSAMDGATRIDAEEHAATCPRCAALLASERVVSSGLRALRESMGREAASERTFLALAAEFARRDQRTEVRGGAGTAWRWWSAAAAAAVLVVAGAVAYRGWPSRPPVALSASPRPPVAVSAPPLPTAAPAPAPARVARRKTPRKRPPEAVAARAAQAPKEVVTRFIPLTYAAAPVESGALVRMRLPRAVLPSLGLPVDEAGAPDSVQADVLLDETGMATAIRFVHQQR